jgi:hypothetical protein
MKRISTILLVVTLMVTTNCNYIANLSKPHLALYNSTPVRLEITEFEWSYGMIGFNKFSGDFETLDHKVYDVLKGKSGLCEVYLEVKSNDKYGQTNKSFNNIGNINLSELNRFQSWEYWSKDGGIRHLIYKHDIQADSTVTKLIIPNVQTNTDSAVNMQEDTLNK